MSTLLRLHVQFIVARIKIRITVHTYNRLSQIVHWNSRHTVHEIFKLMREQGLIISERCFKILVTYLNNIHKSSLRKTQNIEPASLLFTQLQNLRLFIPTVSQYKSSTCWSFEKIDMFMDFTWHIPAIQYTLGNYHVDKTWQKSSQWRSHKFRTSGIILLVIANEMI